jgi:hypothetical protein
MACLAKLRVLYMRAAQSQISARTSLNASWVTGFIDGIIGFMACVWQTYREPQ